MIGAFVLLTLVVLVTLGASVFAVLTNDPLIKGPLAAVILVFLVPGSLLLSIRASRVIESLPSKTAALARIGAVLGAPRALFGALALAAGIAAPFAALRQFSLGVVLGQIPYLPLASLPLSPLLIVVGDVLIRRGLGTAHRPVGRIRFGYWEMDELSFRVKALILACGLALGASLLAFTIGITLFDLRRAQLVWYPIMSIAVLGLSIPPAIWILRRRTKARSNQAS